MTPDKQKEFKLPVDFRGWNLIDRLVAEVLNAKDLDEVDKLKLDCEKEMLAYKNEEVEKAEYNILKEFRDKRRNLIRELTTGKGDMTNFVIKERNMLVRMISKYIKKDSNLFVKSYSRPHTIQQS